ncbi:uncharacterized protein LOC126742971 [Anthonomus grandis grandis]|uniref:uncharacterized protein LOC126742971 n=1 Tax=Anthonomus grandis grandis TaxID=2921223 RepID=UPI0021657775|nr:uncharacterized protein LOC126742971 [Anthonomus grandis grandis]
MVNFKIILVGICVISIVSCQLMINFSPEEMRNLLQYNNQCQRSSGATQQEIISALQNRFSDSPALKSHIFCLGKKMGFVSDNGTFQRETIRNRMGKYLKDQSKMDQLMDKCFTGNGNPKESTYNAIKCISGNRSMVI